MILFKFNRNVKQEILDTLRNKYLLEFQCKASSDAGKELIDECYKEVIEVRFGIQFGESTSLIDLISSAISKSITKRSRNSCSVEISPRQIYKQVPISDMMQIINDGVGLPNTKIPASKIFTDIRKIVESQVDTMETFNDLGIDLDFDFDFDIDLGIDL